MWRRRLTMIVQAAGSTVAARANAFLREGFALAGAAAIVYGVALMHRPSAFIIAGTMCFAVAWGRAK